MDRRIKIFSKVKNRTDLGKCLVLDRDTSSTEELQITLYDIKHDVMFNITGREGKKYMEVNTTHQDLGLGKRDLRRMYMPLKIARRKIEWEEDYSSYPIITQVKKEMEDTREEIEEVMYLEW